MSEFPAYSFLGAIERNLSGGFTREERLAEARRLASNPRLVDKTARELDDLYKTLLSGDYLENLISAAESGLTKANKIQPQQRIVPERGGATNTAKAYNRGQIDKKQQEVDRMQTLFDVLSNIKSGREASLSGEAVADHLQQLEAVADPKMGVSDEPAAPAAPAAPAKPDAEPERTLDEYAALDMADSDREMPVYREPATPTKAMSPVATAATEAALGAVEEATAEPEADYTDEAVGLFKNTHGTEFDPNSKMDRGKLDKMKGMLAKQGGLGGMSANQFALQVYRNS